MAIKDMYIFHIKALQNAFTEIEIFGMQKYHLATLLVAMIAKLQNDS
jgi:hypothetical protein